MPLLFLLYSSQCSLGSSNSTSLHSFSIARFSPLIIPVSTPFLLLAQSFLPLYFSLHSLNKASPSFKWFWYSKPLVNWVDVLTFLFQRYLNLENWKFLYAYILCPILIKTVGNFFFFLLYLQSLIRPLVRLIDADKIHHRKSLD
jgi:hypothetical protein